MFLKLGKKGKNDFFTYFLTIFITIVGYILGQIPLGLVLMQQVAAGKISNTELLNLQETNDLSILQIDNNLKLLLLLIMYILAMVGLYIGVTKFHKKSFKDIITAASKIRWSRILFAFMLWMLLTVVLEFGIYFMDPLNYTLHFQPLTFFILLLIALFILPIQTSFEEIFFRGYLMQGIGRLTPYRFIPLIITSVLFGAMHFMNPEVHEFGLGTMMVYYIGVGIFLGIVTLLDDGLELALGIHAATNIYGAVFVTFQASALQTNALFTIGKVEVGIMTIGFFAMAALFLLICIKKYGLNDWSKVFGKDQTTDNNEYEAVV